jgi:alpha-galactosidase
MVRRCLLVLVLCGIPALTARAETIVASGDAAIAQNVDAGVWTLSAGGASLALRLGKSADFALLQLLSPSGQSWTTGAFPDTSLRINGTVLPFGSAASGFVFHAVAAVPDGPRLRLDAVFDLLPTGLRVTRHYAIVAGSPTFESWTTFERIGSSSVRVAEINGVELKILAGRIRWLTGLLGDNADTEQDAAFTLRSRTLTPGERLIQGAQGRSSERTVPWFAIDASPDEFYTALLWSGAWSFSADRNDAGLVLRFGLNAMSTAVTAQPVEGPHVLFGAVRGNLWKASAALRSYVTSGVRQGRGFAPLVTYNTWYAYGTRIDENTMRDAMVRAAGLGAELFVIDAGWYAGAGANGVFDYDTGLGTWEPDATRFPNGLAPLRDYAHSLGMKFGIWVEPERVSLDTVGQPQLSEEAWLATKQGQYGSDHAAQICLAGAAGRRWMLAQLVHLLDTVQPDYLKWDNNFWVNCDRSGHGHGSTDGNFRHVTGLYEILATLRSRYPDLAIENVSGGGSRMDLGMLRYTDVGWMDDRTAPSVHVRHNIEGLSAIFPPAYLLSFAVDTGDEPLHRADLPLILRSRMMGALGLSFRVQGFSDDDSETLRREIAMAKSVRDAQRSATATMLTAQASQVSGGSQWDALQETTTEATSVLLWVFQSDAGALAITIKPIGLPAQTRYEVRSADVGVLGVGTGAELAASGIEVSTATISAGHLLILTAQQ